MCRLSGISTTTSEWVSDSNDIQLACTRKTEWGILDKWAVHVGGGLTHRLFRSDALMLKENDFASAIEIGEDLNDAIKKLISGIDLEKNSKFTVVEVQNINEAILAAETWSEKQRSNSTTDSVVLLLDNMGAIECWDCSCRTRKTRFEKMVYTRRLWGNHKR